jgi:type IV pilus assembly protein PilY1
LSIKSSFAKAGARALWIATLLAAALSVQASNTPSTVPLFVSQAVPPLNMLVMGRDHKLYYEAYNDASDLDGDGVLDVGFKPGITYYGYFNSGACYSYQSSRFEPTAKAGEKNTCSNAWSGNFLNYLATSRMDALRKVLYGGYRATDSNAETVLRAAFIPQDAHSSGKEFDPARDSFNIGQYTPLTTPPTGYRHLFAITTLSDGGTPILRVLTNTTYRIWNWVSKEGPVASDKCVDNSTNCTSGGPNSWSIVPAEYFPNGLTIKTWKKGNNTNHPSDVGSMNTLFGSQPDNKLCGSGSASNINTAQTSNNNPFVPGKNNCSHDSYYTLIEGTLMVPSAGTYKFAVNGDDVVDFFIGSTLVASWYNSNGHGQDNSQSALESHSGSIPLEAKTKYTIKFRHEEGSGGDNWGLYFQPPGSATSTLTNYDLNILACPANIAALREATCKAYPNNGTAIYKPTGILHDFGESDSMKFGLLTGSYAKNTKGGVLRSNIDSFTREVNSTTGQFRANISDGIVSTLDKLRIVDFDYSNHQYKNCGWIGDVPITSKADGMCTMWGNPLAEMMFEGLRYFAGATSGIYTYSSDARDTKTDLGLPAPTWVPPYVPKANNGGGEKSCAVPVMTVISDINPSYDFTLPGSRFNSKDANGNDVENFTVPSKISSLDVSTATDAIGTAEGINGQSFFIGQSTAGNANNAPTAKVIQNLSYARGLSPEEPSKQGAFYSAGIAKFAAENVVGGDKKMMTYSIALASPLPQIKFPIGTGETQSTITLVPFAKSVGVTTDSENPDDYYRIDADSAFQPTDQIVDYYVVKIANTTGASGADYDASVNDGRPYAQFRINYEDVEQGADHDMDAIALYTLSVDANGQLTVKVTSEYASGGIIQHMGYVISGTSADGIYLEVRDTDTPDANYRQFKPYKLNTPPTRAPGYCVNNLDKKECKVLPLSAERTFTTASASGAGFLKNPLWYAAKYGIPDRAASTVTGDPDNYFLVTNALTLKDQLTKAFNDIMQRNNSVTRPGIAIPPTATSDSERYVYRTDYNVETWSGDLIKERTDTGTDTTTQEWKASSKLPSSRNIKIAGSSGDLVDATWTNFTGPQQAALATDPQTGNAPAVDANGAPSDPAAAAKGQARLNFVLGSDTSFRERDSLLGDIVNSSPVVVEGAQYLAHLAGTIDGTIAKYAAFRSANKSCTGAEAEGTSCRRSQVYVGANDGMLHAFDAKTGVEKFAFIPSAVIPHLNQLTASDYNEDGGRHRYYVDGTPVVRDVYIAPKGSTTKEWRTVLVGTLRGGGRSIFALDVTNPDDIKLLWEFGAGDDIPDEAAENTPSDVGYSFPVPTLARLHSGEWAVVTGNGYDSASGRASLLLIDIATGELIRNIPVATTGDAAVGNGLSSVRVADNNNDGIADYAYAGDLKGNLWRFDLIDTSGQDALTAVADADDDYKVSFGGSPLFRARESYSTGAEGSADGNSQAITAPPSLVRHPSLIGYIVIFGTGRYFSDTDKASTDMQTLFGIWDKKTRGEPTSNTPLLTRSNLQAQTFGLQTTASFADGEASASKTIRVLSQNKVGWDLTHIDSTASAGKSGWYLDLKVGSSLKGERVVDEMAVRGQALLVSTRTPESDPCSAGVEGWTYGINPFTGGRTGFNVFDLNGDNTVDIKDAYTTEDDSQIASGFQTPAGGFTLSGNMLFDTSGSAIQTSFGPNTSGRQTWNIVPPTTDDDDEESEE